MKPHHYIELTIDEQNKKLLTQVCKTHFKNKLRFKEHLIKKHAFYSMTTNGKAKIQKNMKWRKIINMLHTDDYLHDLIEYLEAEQADGITLVEYNAEEKWFDGNL